RIAIARSDEVKVSRRLASVEQVAAQRVRVRNLSSQVSFGLEGGPLLKPGQECERDFPVILTLGTKVVRIQKASMEESGSAIKSLERPTDFPLMGSPDDQPFNT